MKRIKRIVYVIVGLALLGLLVWAFMPQPVPVDTVAVTRGLLQITVDEEGRTRIQDRYIIAAPLEGQLQRVTLDPGDPVEAHKTVLAVIEPRDPALLDPRARGEAQARVNAARARLEQADPTVAMAEIEQRIAEREYHRLLELAPGGASPKEIDDARQLAAVRAQAVRSAEIARDIIRYELDLAETALRRSFPNGDGDNVRVEIPSPISGKVLRVLRESAMPVTPGMEILEVGDPANLEVEMEVLSTEAVRVRPGHWVQFVRWGGDDALNGVVKRVEPQAFTKVSALGVEEQRVRVISDLTDVPEQYQHLGDAFRVDGRIIVWEESDVLIVPTSALFRVGQQWQVYVVANGRAELRDVMIGQMNGLSAQVLEGLAEGDVVVIHPSDQIAPGTRVERR